MKVLVLGADGFIGRHIAFALRDRGVTVLAQARNTTRLSAMGFQTLTADLTNPATHDAAFWAQHVTGCHVINAAGLLTGTNADMRAVHVLAPQAVLAALGSDARAVLISAVGIDHADTGFARWRRAGEAVFADHLILRPGLVLADTSYGGSALLRAMAVFPLATPVVGDGRQSFNPIHAADLAQVALACLTDAPGPLGLAASGKPWEIGGAETLSQAALIAQLRGWLGLPAVPVLRLPLWLARQFGVLGDTLRLGPISATAVAQLQAGLLANSTALLHHLPFAPRGVSQFLSSRPAGTQDLWHARLYLLKPLIRLTLAVLWLASATLGLLTPVERFLPMLACLPEGVAVIFARGGGLLDAGLGLALLCNWRPRPIAWAQLLLVGVYTIGLTLLAPAIWLDPFGGLLKNLPILALILVHLALTEER